MHPQWYCSATRGGVRGGGRQLFFPSLKIGAKPRSVPCRRKKGLFLSGAAPAFNSSCRRRLPQGQFISSAPPTHRPSGLLIAWPLDRVQECHVFVCWRGRAAVDQCEAYCFSLVCLSKKKKAVPRGSDARRGWGGGGGGGETIRAPRASGENDGAANQFGHTLPGSRNWAGARRTAESKTALATEPVMNADATTVAIATEVKKKKKKGGTD
jgi:hypothetical protein